jgi:hypothetical protein
MNSKINELLFLTGFELTKLGAYHRGFFMPVAFL